MQLKLIMISESIDFGVINYHYLTKKMLLNSLMSPIMRKILTSLYAKL